MEIAQIILIARILLLAFFSILFLQSGIDKITDRAGNLSWLKSHFGQSPLKGVVPPMLSVLTVLELAAGAFSLAGIAFLFLDNLSIGLYGLILSATSLVALFFGQRLAKDYPGAQSLVAYFILSILGMFLMSSAAVF